MCGPLGPYGLAHCCSHRTNPVGLSSRQFVSIAFSAVYSSALTGLMVSVRFSTSTDSNNTSSSAMAKCSCRSVTPNRWSAPCFSRTARSSCIQARSFSETGLTSSMSGSGGNASRAPCSGNCAVLTSTPNLRNNLHFSPLLCRHLKYTICAKPLALCQQTFVFGTTACWWAFPGSTAFMVVPKEGAKTTCHYLYILLSFATMEA